MALTKNQAAAVRRVLAVAATTLPGDDETALSAVELDNQTADYLGVEPVLSRPWRRRAERYAADQLRAQADADAADDDTQDDA